MDKGGQRITSKITGDVSGQVAVGTDIEQRQSVGGSASEVSEAEFAELRQLLTALHTRVAAEAPVEKREAALERVAELEEAVTTPEPDLTTMEYVKQWFARHLPSLAGAVTSVVVNPIVGKLVGAAGDAAVSEFRRRFGEA
jgi:hypothetical protein